MTNKELEARVKELEEENQALKAYKEPQNAPIILPDPSMTPVVDYVETEFVKVRLFKDEYRYKDPLFVGINGKNWLIKRGVEVTLPKYVADFIESTLQEEARIWDKVAQDEEDFKKLTDKQV